MTDTNDEQYLVSVGQIEAKRIVVVTDAEMERDAAPIATLISATGARRVQQVKVTDGIAHIGDIPKTSIERPAILASHVPLPERWFEGSMHVIPKLDFDDMGADFKEGAHMLVTLPPGLELVIDGTQSAVHVSGRYKNISVNNAGSVTVDLEKEGHEQIAVNDTTAFTARLPGTQILEIDNTDEVNLMVTGDRLAKPHCELKGVSHLFAYVDGPSRLNCEGPMSMAEIDARGPSFVTLGSSNWLDVSIGENTSCVVNGDVGSLTLKNHGRVRVRGDIDRAYLVCEGTVSDFSRAAFREAVVVSQWTRANRNPLILSAYPDSNPSLAVVSTEPSRIVTIGEWTEPEMRKTHPPHNSMPVIDDFVRQLKLDRDGMKRLMPTSLYAQGVDVSPTLPTPLSETVRTRPPLSRREVFDVGLPDTPPEPPATDIRREPPPSSDPGHPLDL
jgi:hypothetical protein